MRPWVKGKNKVALSTYNILLSTIISFTGFPYVCVQGGIILKWLEQPGPLHK